MFGQMYTLRFRGTLTNAGTDHNLFEIQPATNRPVAIVSIELANRGADVADAEEEMVDCDIIRGNTTGGNGTATTPRPVNPNGGAAAATCETLGTAPSSAGSPVSLYPFAWNVRTGWDKIWTPGTELQASAAQTIIAVHMLGTVSDDVDVSGVLTFEEF